MRREGESKISAEGADGQAVGYVRVFSTHRGLSDGVCVCVCLTFIDAEKIV